MLDGVGEKEACVAVVVGVGVFGHHAGEVQVTVEPHGHASVLLDGHHVCGDNRAGSRHRAVEEDINMEGCSLN